MAFQAQKNNLKKNDNPVRYLDGSALLRPFNMPLPFLGILALFVIVAAIIGGIFLFKVIDEITNAPIREAEATQTNLDREVNLGLPVLKDLIQLDDATILESFNAAGFTLYDLGGTLTEGAGGGMDIIKLPDGVTIIDAGLMYSKGVSKLSSSEAARLLNGSWRMQVGRDGYLDMKVHYSDFSSGSVETAVQNAIAAEGLAESILGESGVDSAGNTYQLGQVDVNGTVYNWQVAACPLLEFYSIDGLPENAAYVGIRIYL